MVVWLALAWVLVLVVAWAVREVVRAARTAPHQAAPSPQAPPPGPPTPPDRPVPPRHPAGRLAALGSVLLTLAGIGAAAAVGNAVAAQATPDEHATLYKPIKAIDARLARLVPRGGSVVLEGAAGRRHRTDQTVAALLPRRARHPRAGPRLGLRLGTWYELYKRPYREAIYLSDVPRSPVRHVPLAFDVSFREGRR